MSNFYTGYSLGIFSMYGKESVISPLMYANLKVSSKVPENLGAELMNKIAFDKPKIGTTADRAREKANLAVNLTGCQLGIASEASFVANTDDPSVINHEEVMVLIDTKNNIEIRSSILTTETNYLKCDISSLDELAHFANKVGFPSHGIIMTAGTYPDVVTYDNMHSWDTLQRQFFNLLSNYDVVNIEADMRARQNPTRMKIVKEACQKLIVKLNHVCYKCGTPGMELDEERAGLPCMLCENPTKGILSHIYKCQKCGWKEEQFYPNKRRLENPIYCDPCNE